MAILMIAQADSEVRAEPIGEPETDVTITGLSSAKLILEPID